MQTRIKVLVAGMSNGTRMLNNNKGFSLIRWMAAIATIGLLLAIVIPHFICCEECGKSYCSATVNDVNEIHIVLEDYFANPANVTANTQYNPAVPPSNYCPYILVGADNTGAYTGNTLLSSYLLRLALVVPPLEHLRVGMIMSYMHVKVRENAQRR